MVLREKDEEIKQGKSLLALPLDWQRLAILSLCLSHAYLLFSPRTWATAIAHSLSYTLYLHKRGIHVQEFWLSWVFGSKW